ncbi:MAG TPA: GlsB/YeaQ/YmgE family stress response membrane protein [Thermoanaerobaculia bacterium]|nr:GlsB/YeaQ/YmgE family stress response membrane protein [Thermoanaerobaculia bacterium]
MGCVSLVLFGLLAGALAKFLMPGKDPGGWIVTTLLGIGGAALGGWLSSHFLNGGPIQSWSLKNLVVAVVGSILLLLIYRMFRGRSS